MSIVQRNEIFKVYLSHCQRKKGRGDEGEKKDKVIEGRGREKKREDEGEEGTEGGRIKW